MTSGTGSKLRSAFSLLELVITLAIIIFVTSSIAILMAEDADEKFLLENAEGIEALLSKAKSHSILQREDCVLSLKGNAMQAMAIPSRKRIGSYRVNSKLKVSYRPEPNLPWSHSDSPVEFSFRKSGLNAPLQLRISYEKGFCEMQVNVLTGEVLRSIKLR